jgi:hypothetical protein
MKVTMLLTLAFVLQAKPPSGDITLPPAGAQVRYTTEGIGVQIYHCAAQPSGLQWVFDSPEANLLDASTNRQLGTHGAGPTWTWGDGSAIKGRVLQKQASPDPTAIPWLLLETQASGTTRGALTGVAYVRRSNTQAGLAPSTGCDAAHVGNLLRVPYEATYIFYTKN